MIRSSGTLRVIRCPQEKWDKLKALAALHNHTIGAYLEILIEEEFKAVSGLNKRTGWKDEHGTG
tara:strand:+ start:1237 stop:1428 length:192 start_codon:yes stop_codon:yes gene_type:complete